MNILIVGKNSFIGQGVGAWICQNMPQARVEYISVRDDAWLETDLSVYDAVLFAAAIVHKPEVTDWDTYEKINVQLPIRFAQQAKSHGVRQFVFLSTVSVYCAQRSLPGTTWIHAGTPLEPETMYGKSKLLAENGLQKLADEHFCVSIIRPTYVYGQGCRGRHVAVQAMLAKKLPVLPRAYEDVAMGMIYIDNLAELCWLAAKSECSGIYHAQDRCPMSTSAILHALAPEKKQVRCQWLLQPFSKYSLVNRVFGGSAYMEEIARCPLGEYQHISMAEGIRRTVNKE